MYPANLSPVDERGRLIPLLRDLISIFDIDSSLSLEDLTRITLERWVTPGTERWDETEVPLSDEATAAFWSLIKPSVLYHELPPEGDDFDYALVLGGTLKPQDRKNAYLVRLAETVRFGRIAHLGASDRTLTAAEERSNLYRQWPGGLPVTGHWTYPTNYHNEADMMSALWSRSVLPEYMREIPVDFVNATASIGHRAHSADTYQQWFEQSNPTPGTVLLISISPHGPFQAWDAVSRLQSAGFEVEVAAASAEFGPLTVSYTVGAVGRWLRSYVRATAEITV